MEQENKTIQKSNSQDELCHTLPISPAMIMPGMGRDMAAAAAAAEEDSASPEPSSSVRSIRTNNGEDRKSVV